MSEQSGELVRQLFDTSLTTRWLAPVEIDHTLATGWTLRRMHPPRMFAEASPVRSYARIGEMSPRAWDTLQSLGMSIMSLASSPDKDAATVDAEAHFWRHVAPFFDAAEAGALPSMDAVIALQEEWNAVNAQLVAEQQAARTERLAMTLWNFGLTAWMTDDEIDELVSTAVQEEQARWYGTLPPRALGDAEAVTELRRVLTDRLDASAVRFLDRFLERVQPWVIGVARGTGGRTTQTSFRSKAKPVVAPDIDLTDTSDKPAASRRTEVPVEELVSKLIEAPASQATHNNGVAEESDA